MREEERDEDDLELRLRTPDDPRQDIRRLDVRPHEMVARGRFELREPLAVRLERVEVVRRDDWSEERDEDECERDSGAEPQHRARHPARLGYGTEGSADAAAADVPAAGHVSAGLVTAISSGCAGRCRR